MLYFIHLIPCFPILSSPGALTAELTCHLSLITQLPASDEDLAGFSSFAGDVTFALRVDSGLVLSLIGCGCGSESV